MWTVVYVAQKPDEISRIKSILNNNKIISRVRQSNSSSEESGMCFEIMVPAAELCEAQNLIIEAEL